MLLLTCFVNVNSKCFRGVKKVEGLEAVEDNGKMRSETTGPRSDDIGAGRLSDGMLSADMTTAWGRL